jgi:D-alanyl-lipoteichoic acid acyltransferase DltB (MBOAT superfamily)
LLFSSFVFLFGFLPLALVLTYAVGRFGRLPRLVLTLLSLGFYAFWRPIHLPLLLGSIVFNYYVGGLIQNAHAQDRRSATRTWLTIGVLVDLSLLGYFKYANFLVDNLDVLSGAHIQLSKIALPLGISFFTFQKIAYLVDSARGEARKMTFLDFSLFAAFFPQLIAGPIVHYKEVVPQLQSNSFARLVWRNLVVGLVILSIGLFKKTVIADTLAGYADPLFAMGAHGKAYGLVSGWLCAVTYTFQVYFDFSGYSDLAIGLARMFGVKLPLNFHSPLRAASIIDYWRRWHMTLQRFIVAYVFQPLAVSLNRRVALWRLKGWSAFLVGIAIPTLVTFIAVGTWHGAGWTFVLFGFLHAIYICTNEAWREHRSRLRRAYRRAGKALPESGLFQRLSSHALTLLAVAFANVVFRAHSIADAGQVWLGMSGFGGGTLVPGMGVRLMATLSVCAVIVFLMPNTQQIMGRFDPAFNWKDWRSVAPAPVQWTWTPSLPGLIFASVTLFLGVMFIQRGQAVFLYFNF